MTREQATKILYNQWQGFLEDNIDYAGISEAYKMAIKALEQEPCEDAISRQVAIEAVKQAIYNHDSAIMRLAELPSVTPQPKTGHWIPVSERLPEEDGTYLVSELVYSSNKPRGYGYETSQNIVDFVEFFTVNGWRRARSLYEITAWMPLPQPYKLESE